MSGYRWLTEASQSFLDRDYLVNNQSTDGRVTQGCYTAEKILKKPGFAEKFKSYFQKGWYSWSTPVWTNFGNDRGLPISCFGSYIDDSMESIAHNWAEVCMMTKHGGGTSAFFGKLRNRGAKIRDNGESSGSVHFMQAFDMLINIISQGKTRRGNFSAYLPIDHPDILEFLMIRTEGFPIQDLSYGVCVPDYWMKEMIGDGTLEGGDKLKRVIWAKVLEARANFGFPYIFFTDTVNNNTVDCYKDKNMKIHHSNLCCVVGNERVVSNRGLLTVKELYEQGGELELFDGEEMVKASEMKLISPSEEVRRITLKNGMTHTVTKCHKIQTNKGMVRVADLRIGDLVAVQNKKGLFGKKFVQDVAFLSLEKGKLPDWLWTSDEATQQKYIGTLFLDGNKSISDANVDFLREVQIVLANLGVNSFVEMLPDNLYELSISAENEDEFSEIVCMENTGTCPVYCCEVYTDKHRWVCNGVQTKNSEIMLPNDETESFVCDLSSMNVLYYDEWKNTDAVELLTYFLDAVMTEFIDKASKIAFMERPVRFAERHRALGIGQIGWHSYLQSKMIPFESMEAKLLNVEIAKNIKTAAYAASEKMAKEYGEPEVLQGYGRRNSTLIAIAPTKSSAFIMGQASESIEANRTNYFIKDLQKGKYTVKNQYLEKLLEKKGKNTDFVWDSILKQGGSVQDLSFLDDHEKNVFKTFGEISQKEVVIQAASRQKYVDQGQSLNLMIHPSVPTKDVNALMIEGWKLGIKSYYYQYSVNAAQAFSRNLLQCVSCEG